MFNSRKKKQLEKGGVDGKKMRGIMSVFKTYYANKKIKMVVCSSEGSLVKTRPLFYTLLHTEDLDPQQLLNSVEVFNDWI